MRHRFPPFPDQQTTFGAYFFYWMTSSPRPYMCIYALLLSHISDRYNAPPFSASNHVINSHLWIGPCNMCFSIPLIKIIELCYMFFIVLIIPFLFISKLLGYWRIKIFRSQCLVLSFQIIYWIEICVVPRTGNSAWKWI